MRTNGNTDMQPSAAELMRCMSIDDEARAVELALQRVNRNMVLVQDTDSRVCWINGQLKIHRPGASSRWTCRRISVNRLVKIAPAKRIMEILKAQANAQGNL